MLSLWPYKLTQNIRGSVRKKGEITEQPKLGRIIQLASICWPNRDWQIDEEVRRNMEKKYFAFVFLGADENCDPDKDRKVVETPSGGCITIPVHSYDQAVSVCRKLADENLFAIELCGGFGHIGTAKIVNAVQGKVPIGVVRFDIHPLLQGKGGDSAV